MIQERDSAVGNFFLLSLASGFSMEEFLTSLWTLATNKERPPSMHSLGHSIPLFLAFAWLLWPPFGVPLSSTSFQMKFFCLMEWCLSQKWVRGINSNIEKAHFHPFPCACDPCMYGHPKPWKSLHHNPSFSKSKPQVRKLRFGTSLPYSPHFLSLSFSKPKKLVGSLSGFTVYAFWSEGCCSKKVHRCAI